ncbi:MAG: DUF308 domain-containing protein [Actinomycetaceae bacterium]|nr:DUF308 domain-containing protein [Actinomycetaceae bacterium]
MKDVAKSAWPWFFLRGVFALAFSAISIVWPDVTLVLATRFLSIWLLVDGLTTLARSATMSKLPATERSPITVIGVAGIAVGIFGLFFPFEAIRALGMILGLWLLLSGISQLSFGMQVRRRVKAKTPIMLMGLVSMLAGIAAFAVPELSVGAFSLALAVVAAVFGVVNIYAAKGLRGLAQQED